MEKEKEEEQEGEEEQEEQEKADKKVYEGIVSSKRIRSETSK